jgi:HSP20 family protein
MAKAVEEEKAVTTKKPSEIVSRGEEFEHWLDHLMEDMWRRPFPSLFGRDRWLPIRPSSIRMPSLDVYEEKDSVVVKAELPGMKKEDVEVNLAGEILTIKGEKKEDKEVKEDNYYRRERSYGSFLRSVGLPCEVKSDEIKASFKDGVLEIRMPKTEASKTKSVSVRID